MSVHKKVAEALGMAIPPEDVIAEAIASDVIIAEPHDVVTVNNEELPPTQDTAKLLTEGEKQLEELIVRQMNMIKTATDKLAEVEPKYYSRALEVLATLSNGALSSIIHKNELQLKKDLHRMKQAAFTRNKSPAKANKEAETPPQITNQVVVAGSREDAMKMAEKMFGSSQTIEAAVVEIESPTTT